MSARAILVCLALAWCSLTGLASGQSTPREDSPLPAGRQATPAEDFSFMAGRWETGTRFQEADGSRPRFVNVLEITTSPTEITISKGRPPSESFRLDGTITNLNDGLTGFAVLVGDGIALTTRRTRQSPDGPVTTTSTDLYVVSGDTLTVQSRRSQARANGTLGRMPSPSLVTVTYRRVRQ